MCRRTTGTSALSGNGRDEVRGWLPRNHLRSCLLLLLAEGPSHGYELLGALPVLGLEEPDTGGLYRALRAMEEEGLVRSWWAPSQAGPARRTYDLTDEGREWLHLGAGALRQAHRSLEAYLGRYEHVVDTGSERTR